MFVRFDRGAQARHICAMTEPRRAASIALFHDTAVLLIRRAFAPSAGFWTLPGGRLESGETPEICIRREIDEELGLVLGKLVFVQTHRVSGFELNVFTTHLHDQIVLRPNAEIADWRWHQVETPLPEPHTDGLGAILSKARRTLLAD